MIGYMPNHFSRVQLYVILQVPLSMGFSRQKYWSGLPLSFSRESSQLRDPTFISYVSCNGRRDFTSLVAPGNPQHQQWNVKVKVAKSCLILCDSMDYYSPWNSLGQNTGVGSLFLLQQIFPTQGSNPGLPHWRPVLYQLSYKESPASTVSHVNCMYPQYMMGFPCGSASKESVCNVGDLGSTPWLGRSPREGKGYPLQYSGLENSMDCIVHAVAKSRTWLRDRKSVV